MRKEFSVIIEFDGEIVVGDLIKPIVDAIQKVVGGSPTITITPKEKIKISIQDFTKQLPKSNYTVHIKK